MIFRVLNNLAQRSGAAVLLERLGVYGRASELLRLALDPGERERWRIIRLDFKKCQDQFRRIARGAPLGDPKKVAWIICSMPTVWGLKMEGILSLAMRLKYLTPVVVHHGYNSWIRRYHDLFGMRQYINFHWFRSVLPSVAPDPQIIEFMHSRPTVGGLLRLVYHQVDIGRIALSNVLNHRKFIKFDLAHEDILKEVCGELIKSQSNVFAAEQMLAQNRPAIALVLEKGLSPMAEIFGVCVANGIPVVQYVGSQNMNEYVLKRFSFENRHQHPFSLDDEIWEWVKRMPWSSARETELMKEFAESYSTGSWFNRKFLHEGKQIKASHVVRKQLDLDPSKKTAIIFSHVLWDATFFYGKGLFDDYETWLLETVRAACANPNVNWIVKLHPDLVWKLKYEGFKGELRDTIAIRSAVGSLPIHVKLVSPDTDISTYSFFSIADYCITVRGTIGIEMACHGVPVLTAGTGRYSQLGFTIDSNSSEEYLHRLAQIQNIPRMSNYQIELARRFAYALFKLRLWKLHSFEMVKMPLANVGHPLDHNLVPHIENFKELAKADDINRFADWLATDEVDYFQPDAEVFNGAGAGEGTKD